MTNKEMLPVCPHDADCGGCIHQGKSYEEQLRLKEEAVLELMKKKELAPETYLPMKGSEDIYHYRNKMEYTFGDMVKGGEMTLGMHKKGRFMSIATVDKCQLVHEDFNKILDATLEFCKEKGYTKYHKKTHEGLMRHLLLRRGINTGEILAAIVTSGEPGFDEGAWADLIESLDLENKVVGILRIINDQLADAVKCDELRVLRGREYYNEVIMGLRFKVGIFSFFQTNVRAAERLYKDAISMIEDYADKTVFDLFCGTGTISQAMATAAKKVIGVDIVEQSIEMARESAAENGFDNCEFIAADVFDALDQIEDKPDVIVVDPPRVGIMPKTLEKILDYGIDEILYISCNYKTMLENAELMKQRGYEMKALRVYDNFPFTKHVECVVLMSRT